MSTMGVRQYRVSKTRTLPEERGRSINIYVPVEDIEYADQLANERQVSRSRAISEVLAEHRARAAKRNGK